MIRSLAEERWEDVHSIGQIKRGEKASQRHRYGPGEEKVLLFFKPCVRADVWYFSPSDPLAASAAFPSKVAF